MKKRVFYIGLFFFNVANAQDTKVPQPPPVVEVPSTPVVEAPSSREVLNVAVSKPIRNTSDVLSIKDATNARSEYGTMPPVKIEAGPDKFELPIIEVLGAEVPVDLGNLVELSIKPIDKLPAGLKSVIYSWTILPPPPRVIPWVDSSKIIFGTGIKSQEYTIILTATYAFINDDLKLLEHRTDTIIKRVAVGSEVIPSQSVSVKVDRSNGFNEVAVRIKKSLSTVSAVNYSEDDKKKDFKALAASFRKVAELAEANPNLSASTIKTTQVEANGEALKANFANYKEWYVGLGKEFQTISKDESAARLELIAIYRVIASALEAY